MTEWMHDDRAHVHGEAVVGLGRVAQALPLDALQRWFAVERQARLRGGGVTGADPRLLDAMGNLTGALEGVAQAMIQFDDVQEEIELERAQAAELTEAAEVQQQAASRAEQEQATYGDRRDEPVPDDWTV